MDADHVRRAVMAHRQLLTPPFDEIINMEGYDAVRAFTGHYGGNTVYIAHTRHTFAPCVKREILNQYNGYNAPELMRRFGYSEAALREIVKKK
jgi:Mor family transcriptional regulator